MTTDKQLLASRSGCR